MSPRVAIITDSACCLPSSLVKATSISIVPHQLIIDGRPYKDGVDIGAQEFYELSQEQVVSTAGPNSQAFSDAIMEASKTSNEILCIIVSPRFSASTYDSARAAVHQAMNLQPHLAISLVDSQAAAGAQGLLTLEAAKMSLQGSHLPEIVDRIHQMIPNVHLLAFLDTLSYLARSGRIPKVKAWAGAILGIRPLTELSQGEARLLSKPRGRARATNQLLETTMGRVGHLPVKVNVMHANALHDAELLIERIRNFLKCRETFISEFTPVMGTHTGPGLLGIAFYITA